MMLNEQITLCLTIGRRPDLLRQTLHSLKDLPSVPLLAINDFGDAETDAVFRELCPQGRLLQQGRKLGHHAAVDALYREVMTPCIFHGEDDWLFHRNDFLNDALALLEADPLISCVCLRDIHDVPSLVPMRGQIHHLKLAGIDYQRVDHLHDQWHGYSFNPHVARKSLWQELDGFSGFEKERHISRHLRSTGRYIVFLCPPACTHIGEGRSAFAPRQGPLKRFKNWLRGT